MEPFAPYKPPDFSKKELASAPAAVTVPAPDDGVLPPNFHATSNHPEYVHLGGGEWLLARESRMDAVFILKGRQMEVKEPRLVKRGDQVVIGRTENGEEGIYIHTSGFEQEEEVAGKFVFRSRGTRETPFSRSYDEIYELLRYERDNGHILWVLGPAVAFDRDSREAMSGLIKEGYCHGLLAGNALATHDMEAAIFGTGLGQDIYTRILLPNGHYNHLDAINEVCRKGSLADTISSLGLKNGIMASCIERGVPFVLSGSIRDDGPLPEVITDSSWAQDAMRFHTKKATTVIAMATQLHAIATGNMIPGYKVLDSGAVRPVFFYIVDMSEFAADKLANRGSAQARAVMTNAQDFIANLWHNLAPKGCGK